MPIRNVNDLERPTLGQRAADLLAGLCGGWPFLLVQTAILTLWIGLNGFYLAHSLAHHPFDPYPFILLNLVLSFEAAYASPIILMAQNRQTQRDRIHAENDYQVNRDNQQAILAILAQLDELEARVGYPRGDDLSGPTE